MSDTEIIELPPWLNKIVPRDNGLIVANIVTKGLTITRHDDGTMLLTTHDRGKYMNFVLDEDICKHLARLLLGES